MEEKEFVLELQVMINLLTKALACKNTPEEAVDFLHELSARSGNLADAIHP